MSQEHRALLAIDAGQTGIKTRLIRADGTATDALFPGVLTDRPLLPQLAEVVASAGGSPDTITFGVSGLTDAYAEASALLAHPALGGVRRVVVTHDSVTSFLGVLGDRCGAVVAAGTGVVTLGVGPEHSTRVDGWGYIMGDAGSGYWIGRSTLDAVMRAYDGRGPATALTAVVQDRWPDLDSAYTALQASEDRVRTVASFAAPTALLAATGDEVAGGICRAAATELALAVTTALRVTDAPDDAAVGAVGGVFGSDLIRAAFADAVRADRPDARFVPPAGSGLDGAVSLAGLGAQHPLRERFADLSRG
ncbi:BadF/BadG/BcrA/BcrD ATPase family protein [Microbacterium sp. 69-10]|uniref:N-acetylglucosamine kinase n=1 Tax=Microbacterium sp. 69-10 TaxID=1895783 RepID=UPI0025F3BC2C|nr:BadF/BadG/BcrA/BcrD ATPase family protein [Microbacterium sp. 69-10]